MNMIRKPSHSTLSGSFQEELLEIKSAVDDICRTRSELCDVLDQLCSFRSRSNENIAGLADSLR